MTRSTAPLRRPVVGALLGAALLATLTGVLTPRPAGAQDCGDLSPPPAEPSSLALGESDLRLDAGESATVPATFDIGRRPQKVDVFFAIDASKSMEGLIDSLSSSIADAALELAQSGIDLQIGLATFTDLYQRPYVLVRQVSTVDCGITSDFDLQNYEGGTEPHLFVLHHIVTGEGLATGNRYAVEPGTGAAWRARTRLVIQATDEPYDESLPNQPPVDQIGREYRQAGVAHAAIQVVDSRTFGPLSNQEAHQDPQATRDDLDRTSAATGTRAPPGGIDCTGDGLVTPPNDLSEGDPVVCTFDVALAEAGLPHASAADIAAAMIDALREPIPADVVVADGGGLDTGVAGGAAAVDVTREPAQLRPELTVTCPPDATGSEHVVTVAGRFDGETLDTGTLTVTCGQPVAAPPPAPPAPPPAPEPPAPPPAQPPPPPAPAPPVAAPAPGPGTISVSVPNAATAGATSSAPAQATQLVPGVGIVPDEVREFQVASELADRDASSVLATRRRPGPSPVVVWIAGAMLLSAMTAAEWQRRTAPAHHRRRSR